METALEHTPDQQILCSEGLWLNPPHNAGNGDGRLTVQNLRILFDPLVKKNSNLPERPSLRIFFWYVPKSHWFAHTFATYMCPATEGSTSMKSNLVKEEYLWYNLSQNLEQFCLINGVEACLNIKFNKVEFGPAMTKRNGYVHILLFVGNNSQMVICWLQKVLFNFLQPVVNVFRTEDGSTQKLRLIYLKKTIKSFDIKVTGNPPTFSYVKILKAACRIWLMDCSVVIIPWRFNK